MSMLLKTIQKFNAISTKMPIASFTEIENNIKIHMEPQRTLNGQNNLKKEKQRWRYHTSWFQNILQSYSD